MKLKQIIEEAKSYFGEDRKRLKEKILSFDFNGKEYKEWRKLLKKTTKQAFDIHYGMSEDLIENVKDNRLAEIDWHWIGDLSWEWKILLNKGIKQGFDWDKKLTEKCKGTAHILQVYISDILPCYAIDSYSLTYNKKKNYYEFKPFQVKAEKHLKEVNNIRDLLASKGYLYISKKKALKKYKELYSDCNAE
ncbi:MAG: hypothetical protein AAF696_02335, partial [Bacteroidota bacterium]